MVYLHTSSIIKLYVDESGSDDVRSLLSEEATLATSSVAYVEFRSAMTRLRRERKLNVSEFVHVKDSFEADWQGYFTVEPTRELLRTAGGLAEEYRLRTYDAVHLAPIVKRPLGLESRTSSSPDSMKS